MLTYYQILSIPETASLKEIKSAFRKLSLRYHPDRNDGDKTAETKFREVLEAYKVLSDLDKKAWYDRQLFYKRQPPQPAPQPQSQPRPQPIYQQPPFRKVHRRYTEEYVQPDFSRMPWRFMGFVTGGLLLFFVLLYNFGPKPRDINQELRDEEVRIEMPPISTVSQQSVKLKDGTSISLSGLASRYPSASVVELYSDIDGDGADELHLSVTYPGRALFTSRDYIFRRAEMPGEMDVDTKDALYEEFFTYENGLHIVGDNMRLYFGADIETYYSCNDCQVTGLPNPRMVPAIYLRARNGRLRFAETNAGRNREIEENLAYLNTRGVPDLANGQDDGTRKEYIRQVVTYYFNNRALPAAETLFRGNYPGSDQDAVWKDAEEIIKTYVQKITSNAAFGNMEVL
ncbi:J domain-containing protein [Chitinophaga sp. GCM10012297]|uniref:J domain-containing protein n=1 Tax=Chitinophaga chungangae TaxID=2821488 RepID=A0ABS3YDP2_9BACT|nr:J domain-containing protein [Chitinophaga chungangae]MBO9152788.1 J domain-containing protein [Chitinophaga chungangae]